MFGRTLNLADTSPLDIYCASRSIYGLARDGQAPALFAKTFTNGAPLFAVGISSLFIALGYMNVVQSSTKAFGYLTSLVTVFALLNWLSILLTYLSFLRGLKAQGIQRNQLPYKGPFQPYGAYYSVFITILALFFQGMPRPTGLYVLPYIKI